MTFKPPTTRRTLLAGLGSLGFLGLGSVAARPALGLDPVEFTRSERLTGATVDTRTPADAAATHSSGTNADLVLDWRATYNGAVLAETDFETSGGTAPGPVFRLADVVPGDEGSLTVRVSVVPPGDEGSASTEENGPGSSVEVYTWIQLSETAENGRSEPELKADDDSPDGGELQDALRVTSWYDVGAGNVDSLGACNGQREPGEEGIADGTLAAVASSPEGAVRLDPHTGSNERCFQPNTSVCVSYSWSLAPDVGNRVQSDSVEFAVGFAARSCDREQGGDDGDQ